MPKTDSDKIPNRGPLAPPDYRIQPKDVVVKDHLWNAFDNNETEISAGPNDPWSWSWTTAT